MLNISADFDRAERLLSDIGRKQLPFAMAMALNDTAEAVKRAEELDIASTFDRPTPFTKRALYLRRASKTRLMARVGVKDVQADYLRMQVTGGTRKPKGAALVVPVSARRNKYGNLPKGALKRAKAKSNVFVASRGQKKTAHLAPGVYERPKYGKYRGKDRNYTSGGSGNKNVGKQKGPKLLMAFEPSASYAKKWQFHELAMRRALATFEPSFVAQVKKAMASAR